MLYVDRLTDEIAPLALRLVRYRVPSPLSGGRGRGMASNKCGIFCIDSEWESDQGEVPATPALEALASHHGVPFESNSFADGDGFFTCLKKWAEAKDTFRILYVWSHGFAGGINAPEGDAVRDRVRLPQMADCLEDWDSAACLAHFGACSTQRATHEVFRDFRDRTGFHAVSGYRRDIDWIKPMAFDLLYLDHVISKFPKHGRLTTEFMEEVHGDLRERSWYGLGRALGFHIDTGL